MCRPAARARRNTAAGSSSITASQSASLVSAAGARRMDARVNVQAAQAREGLLHQPVRRLPAPPAGGPTRGCSGSW
jgi:hypothetical protein